MTLRQSLPRLVRIAPRAHTAGLLALMVLSGLTDGIGILLLVPLLELLEGGRRDGDALARRLLDTLGAAGVEPGAGSLLLFFITLVALRCGIQYFRESLGANLLHRVVDHLRQRCFDALLHTEWRWIAGGRQSDHADLLLTDVSRVGAGLNFGLNLLATLGTMLAYLVAACALSWRMTLLATGCGMVVLRLLAGQRRGALDLGVGLGQANRALQGNVQESLAGIKLAKILGNEGRQLDLFSRVIERVRREQLRFVAHGSRAKALFQFGGAAFLAAYLYAGLRLWHTGPAELLTLVLIFSRLIPMFMSAQQNLHHGLHAVPSLLNIDRLLEECQAWAEPRISGEQQPWPVAEAVCLRDVTVRFPERERPALDAIALRLSARTTTAVMGTSGSGKSTLADVLMGLLAPDAGSLEVDGVVVSGSERLRWRRSVAYVPQEVFLFHDSIRNNLLWARPDAGEADLTRALEQAAADFVFALPQGLDTVVGDGGARLSGGERQRLALARALLKTPSLLILDEATSALDRENEARIRQAIEQLHGNLTVLIIGHRLPTLEHADQVVVLDRGHVRAMGSWSAVQPHLEKHT